MINKYKNKYNSHLFKIYYGFESRSEWRSLDNGNSDESKYEIET